MNINDIAKKANVSTATVSRVINGTAAVRPKTKERVMAAIHEYGYTPSAVAQSLSSKNTHNIGVILPDIENPFFSGVLIGITKIVEEKGYNVFFLNTDEETKKEHESLDEVSKQRMDGVIISPADRSNKETRTRLKSFQEDGVAIVLLDRDLEGEEFNLVSTYDREGAYKGVKKLIDEGHERIAIIKGHPSNTPVQERYVGYEQAMKEAGLPLKEEYIRPADQKSDLAYQATKELMSLPEPPTAIFTCNNMMTLGCLRWLTENNMTPGKDIGLIGFDDIETLKIIGYPLSVVDRSPKEMGTAAAYMLLDMLEKNDESKSSDRVITRSPVDLILRGSEKKGN